MNNKRILFFILIGFTILMITTGIVIRNLGDSKQNYAEDIASMEKQLENLQDIQIKANSIVIWDSIPFDIQNAECGKYMESPLYLKK